MNNQDYTFTVCVKNKDATEYSHRGKTYIEGRKGSEYELYFRNHTAKRVLVIFSVDGLSVMDGKVASDKSNGYVVDAYRSLTVPGWKVDSNTVAKFQFRPQGDKDNTTYVEALKTEGFDVDESNQGVIGCIVIKEKEYIPHFAHQQYYYSQPQPTYYAGSPYSTHNLGYNTTLNAAAVSRRVTDIRVPDVPNNAINFTSACSGFNVVETGLGTGFGDDKEFKTTTTTFERADGIDWIAVINYDTLLNLKKLGVFVEKNDKNKAFPGLNSSGCYVPRNR